MGADANIQAAAAPQGGEPAAKVNGRDGPRTTALVVLCQFVHWLTYAAIPLFLPLILDDLQISFAQGGMLLAAGTLSYALGQIPAGLLADRYGPRRPFFVGLLGWSVLSMTFGLIHVFWLALANQFAAGMFRALLFAPGLSLLASWFPPGRRATAMSLYMLGGFAGSVVLSLAGPLLVSVYGWRAVFIFFAALGVGVAFLYRSRAKEPLRTEPVQQPALLGVLRIFRYPIMWLCSGLQFVRFSVFTSYNFWLPSLLVADRGLSVQTAGLIVAMSAALSAPSIALGGYVSDRLRNPPLVIGVALAVLACTSTLIGLVESVPLLIGVIAVNAVFVQFYFGPLFLVPIEALGHRVAGTATGCANLFANVGGVLTAYFLGVVKDQAGTFAWGFFVIGAMCLAGVAMAVALARVRARALAAGIP